MTYRKMLLDIINVINEGSPWIIQRNGNYFPVKFSLIYHGQSSQGLHFQDLANFTLGVPNLDYVNYKKMW